MEISTTKLAIIGLVSGVAAGLFGIGGGIIIVPALVFWGGMSQHKATGTSLAVLLPPVGLLAVFEYYRHGNVDIRAAIIVAIGLFLGGFGGAWVANKMTGAHLRLGFGLFVISMGVYLVWGSAKKLGWI
jgi:uncharacterized membrane protein YfcA